MNEAGGGGKIPLQPNYVLSSPEDEIVLRNFEWKVFHYRNPGPRALGPPLCWWQACRLYLVQS